MKKTIKQWMMPVFGLAIGVSFVATEAYAAKENVDFTGRARGWYQSLAETKGKNATGEDRDKIPSAEFRADGRIGITISTTEGDWTGSAKAELESHKDGGENNYSVDARDVWAQIENKQFSLKMGRHEANYFCITRIDPFDITSDGCVGQVGGYDRVQGLTFGFKGLPVTPSLTYYAYEENFEDAREAVSNEGVTVPIIAAVNAVPGDKSGFVGSVSGTFANATVGLLFGSHSHKGNEARAVEANAEEVGRTKSDTSQFALYGSYPIGNITVSGGFDSRSNKANDGDEGEDDRKEDTTAMMLAGQFDLGSGMAASASFKNTNTKANDGETDSEDVKTAVTEFAVGFQMAFASTTLQAGYSSSSTKKTEADAEFVEGDGASKSGFGFGLVSNF